MSSVRTLPIAGRLGALAIPAVAATFAATRLRSLRARPVPRLLERHRAGLGRQSTRSAAGRGSTSPDPLDSRGRRRADSHVPRARRSSCGAVPAAYAARDFAGQMRWLGAPWIHRGDARARSGITGRAGHRSAGPSSCPSTTEIEALRTPAFPTLRDRGGRACSIWPSRTCTSAVESSEDRSEGSSPRVGDRCAQRAMRISPPSARRRLRARSRALDGSWEGSSTSRSTSSATRAAGTTAA